MNGVRRGLTLVSVLLAFLSGCSECAFAQAPLPVTTVQDTVYTASGTAASGTVLVSWTGFTTASGAVVPAGNTSVTIAANGLLSVALAPNAGATPIGSYYTATFHLSDGTTSRQYWVVPVTVSGGGPVKLAAVLNQVLPTSVAMQTVSKAYVDTAIAAALTGHPADATSIYVLKAGDTLTGPLVLPADPVSPNQAADKNYVDENVTAIASSLPVFGPSGSTHAAGLVPDPGATAGATRYLREDGTWTAPSVGASGAGAFTTLTASGNAALNGSVNTMGNQANTGAFVHSQTSGGGDYQFFGIFNGSRYYGMRPSCGTALSYNGIGVIALGGWYDGLGVCADVASGGTNPLFGINTTDQGGGTHGVGGNMFNVQGNKVVTTYNNTLDDGSGGQKGLATAPSGSCSDNGAWVFSQDGHATFCASGTWVTKI